MFQFSQRTHPESSHRAIDSRIAAACGSVSMEYWQNSRPVSWQNKRTSFEPDLATLRNPVRHDPGSRNDPPPR